MKISNTKGLTLPNLKNNNKRRFSKGILNKFSLMKKHAMRKLKKTHLSMQSILLISTMILELFREDHSLLLSNNSCESVNF
jgi:hypothetical protein